MKLKSSMALIAALCVAGFAQAVTVEWEEGPWTSDGRYDVSSGSANVISLGESVNLKTQWNVITVAFSVTSVDLSGGWKSILSICSSQAGAGNNDNLRLSISDGSGFSTKGALYLNGNAMTSASPLQITEASLEANKNYVATITLDGAGSVRVVLTSDGSVIANASKTVSNTYENLDTIVLGTGSMVEVNGNRTFGDDVLTVSEVAVLPEPTALALLALGVAGVALRRRVA